MSRYMVDKFVRAVEMSDEQVDRYRADPVATIDAWLAAAGTTVSSTDDRSLTPEEYDAFARKDYGALYALGVHPYLLWHFVEAVFVRDTTWAVLKEEYRAAVSPIPTPDSIL